MNSHARRLLPTRNPFDRPERPFGHILDEVIGPRTVPRQRARITPQLRENPTTSSSLEGQRSVLACFVLDVLNGFCHPVDGHGLPCAQLEVRWRRRVSGRSCRTWLPPSRRYRFPTLSLAAPRLGVTAAAAFDPTPIFIARVSVMPSRGESLWKVKRMVGTPNRGFSGRVLSQLFGRNVGGSEITDGAREYLVAEYFGAAMPRLIEAGATARPVVTCGFRDSKR